MAGAFANPSSLHAEGRAARSAVTAARDAIAALVGVRSDQVVLTSGGTEANVTALEGMAAADGDARPVLISAVEHPSVVAVAERLARRGCEVGTVPVERNGLVSGAELERLMRRFRGALVAVQLANHETGVVQPVAALARIVRNGGGVLHCDAVQAVGRIEVDFTGSGATSMSLAGHKFGALPGAGALVIAPDCALEPLLPGPQESHRRGGTENVPAVVGLGVAARHAMEHFEDWQALQERRDEFEQRLAATLTGTVFAGQESPRLPNTSCAVLPSPMRGAATVAALDLAGVAVSSGPACSSGVERHSGVVEAMGFDERQAERAVRVSLGPGVGSRDMQRLVGELRTIAERLGRAAT